MSVCGGVWGGGQLGLSWQASGRKPNIWNGVCRALAVVHLLYTVVHLLYTCCTIAVHLLYTLHVVHLLRTACKTSGVQWSAIHDSPLCAGVVDCPALNKVAWWSGQGGNDCAAEVTEPCCRALCCTVPHCTDYRGIACFWVLSVRAAAAACFCKGCCLFVLRLYCVRSAYVRSAQDQFWVLAALLLSCFREPCPAGVCALWCGQDRCAPCLQCSTGCAGRSRMS